MGSKGNKSTTQTAQTQTYSADPRIQQSGELAMNQATGAAQSPFSMPVAPIAGFNPFQTQAFGQVQSAQGMTDPYFTAARNYIDQSASPLTGGTVSQYYNPMADNVTAQLQNIFGQQNKQATGNAVQAAGGVGADRVGVAQGNLANQQTLGAGQVYANLYQQAVQNAQADKARQQAAGFAMGQLGPAAQASNLQATSALGGAGNQQQQLQQQQMNAPYQNILAQIAYPFQTSQFLAGITGGLAPAFGGTTTGSGTSTTQNPTPSLLNQILGVGTGLAGIAGASGAFGTGKGGSASPQVGTTAGAVDNGSGFGYGSYGGVQVPTFFADGGEVGGDTPPPFPYLSLPKAGGASPIPVISLPMGGGQGHNNLQGLDKGAPQQSGSSSSGGLGDVAKIASAVLPFILARGGAVTPYAMGEGFDDGGSADFSKYVHPSAYAHSTPTGSGSNPSGFSSASLDFSRPAVTPAPASSFTGPTENPYASMATSFRPPAAPTPAPVQQPQPQVDLGSLLAMLRAQSQPAPQPYQDYNNVGARRGGVIRGYDDGGDVGESWDPEPLQGIDAPMGNTNPHWTMGDLANRARDFYGPASEKIKQNPITQAVKSYARGNNAEAATEPLIDIPYETAGGQQPFPEASKPPFESANVPLPRPNPLGGLTPGMREMFPAIRSAAAERGVHFDIGEGYRPQQRQNILYNQGRGSPGSIVTNTRNSNHTSGNAIDVVPKTVIDEDGNVIQAAPTDRKIGDTLTDLTMHDPRFANMRSGATFSNLYDPRHIELLGNQEARTPGEPGINPGRPDAGDTTEISARGFPTIGGNRDMNIGNYHLPKGDQPYPDALDRDWGQKFARSPWMSLVHAGAAMAQTAGPVGSAIGKGLGAGANALEGQRKELRTEQDMNMKADHLFQQAQFHLDKYQRETPHEANITELGRQRLEQENYAPTFFTTKNGHPIVLEKKSGRMLDGITQQPVDPDEQLSQRGSGTSGGVSRWKYDTWLKTHPGDEQGALDYAGGHKTMSDAEISKSAITLAQKDAMHDSEAASDYKKYVDERRAAYEKQLKQVQSGIGTTEANPIKDTPPEKDRIDGLYYVNPETGKAQRWIK